MRPLAAAVAAIVCVSCTTPTGTGTTATATTTTSTYTPVTGIAVDANGLFQRQGCGTQPGQVYKYVVIVTAAPCPSDASIAPASVVGVGVYDCFADAVFVNLGGSALGLSTDFGVLVDAFDAPSYAAQAGLVASMVQDLSANACPAGPTDDRVAALAQAATWTTSCTARQQPNVQSLAACDPLSENVPDAGAGD